MKGLLLKEWYMMKKYCRAYPFVTVVFLAISCVGDINWFFVFYPCILCGIIPVNLLSFDENSGWISYSGTLPYTKSQIVSSKYLTGLFSMFAILALTSITLTIKISLNDSLRFNDLLLTLLAMFILTLVSVSIGLPLMFRFGTGKGRIAYYVMIGIFCTGSVVASSLFKGKPAANELAPNLLLCGLSVVGIGLYALSWYLSVVFYKKREV